MTPYIVVFLLACLNPANHATCTKLPVTDSTQAQPDGQELSLGGCMGTQGALSAKKYWDDHTELHKAFQFGGWACQVGNKKLPDAGAA